MDIDPTVASSHVIALKSTSIPAYGTRNDCAGTSNLNLASHEDSDAKCPSSIVHRATLALDPDADAATKRHARRATNETTRGAFDARTVLALEPTRRPDRRADARLEREMASSTDIASVRARRARCTDDEVRESAFILSFATYDARFVEAVTMR